MIHSSLVRLCCRIALAAATLSLAPVARAQAAFGTASSFVVGAEDITGYYSQNLKYWDRDNRTVELSRNNFSFALVTGGARVGFHYFVIRNLSLGGTLGYEHQSASNTYQDNPGTWSTDVPSNWRLAVLPKVGYALMFTDMVGVWFRGGLGYERFKQRRSENDSANYARDSFLVMSGDILFIASPLPHLGLMLGPTFDFSLAGSHFEHDSVNGDYSHDAKLRRLGITTGIVGYFF